MKVTIDRSGCIGCGLCAETCPEVFQIADDGLAEVCSQPDGNTENTVKEAVSEAAENCPVNVITTEE